MGSLRYLYGVKLSIVDSNAAKFADMNAKVLQSESNFRDTSLAQHKSCYSGV